MSFSFDPLRLYLRYNGISKDKFLSLTGLSQSTLSKIMKDDSVSMSVIDRICSRLNCEINDVISHKKD